MTNQEFLNNHNIILESEKNYFFLFKYEKLVKYFKTKEECQDYIIDKWVECHKLSNEVTQYIDWAMLLADCSYQYDIVELCDLYDYLEELERAEGKR